MKFSIRLLYLYLFAAVGLFIFVIGCIRLIDLGMKIYVFNNADLYEFSRPVMAPAEGEKGATSSEEQAKHETEAQKSQERENKKNRQRETSGALAMIIIGAPLYLYHWKTISRENKKK